MKCWLLLVVIWIFTVVLFGAFSGSTPDVLNSHNSITSLEDDDVFRAPARRSLLSANQRPDTALVASLDGTIHLLEVGSLKPLWSFSSGPEIYSSYQAPISNVSGLGSNYYIDCGEDWELYAHSSRGEVKLIPSLEEYVSSTPQITEDGGIVLGFKKTTAFLVDAKTGGIIHTYSMSDSPTATQSSVDGFLYNVSVREQYQSRSDSKDQLPLYVTRTDYRLTSYMPNSNVILWNLSVSEIGSAYLCQDMEKSLGDNLLDFESSEPGLPYKMPLPCQSRALVYRVRNQSLLELVSMPNGLPDSHHQDTRLPTSTSDVLPSQPNVEKILELFPSTNNSDDCVDMHERKDLDGVLPSHVSDQNCREPHVLDVKETSIHDFLTLNGKSSKSQLLPIFVTILAVVAYHYNLFSTIKIKWVALSTYTMAMDVHSKRKRPRKTGKNGINHGKQENKVKYPQDERGINFFEDLNQTISCRTNGRTIGKLFVFDKEIAKGSNGTIVLEGIHEGRPVAVKRLVKAYNNIASKEIQNLIVSDRHPNIVRWYGVEQDQDFVYLALERCYCSLNDLILMHSKSFGKNLDIEVAEEFTIHLDYLKGFMQDCKLWKSDGYPSPLLLRLMRDVISGIVHLHELGIVHRDLKPQNVLIASERSICAKLSDMGISKHLVGDASSFSNHATGYGSSGWQAPEQLLHRRQTRAVDLFSLGCVLFFCLTGGRHPFGNHLERDINIIRSKIDLFLVEHIPEAVDLLLKLLDPNAESRPKASEVLYHPLFWNAEMRLSFLRDTSDRVELEDRGCNSDLFNMLENIAPLALGSKWNEKMDPSFLNNIGRYRRYKFDSVRDFLRVMRNKLNHYRELPAEIQELIGPVPEGFDRYFTSRFPKLLTEVYKVMLKFCRNEEWFSKYFIGTGSKI
ncbi:serine/threonine-protein kinase/endoribonuclease IRE1a-like isoform X2 [Henckelia pumila]|uniref:serine/threonine-protein kinase/endoribonuclease IRE1a-like isoform X2 n=1 Tax=Henckelia pumila TaxID=405737 RepID=UPI003C6E670B